MMSEKNNVNLIIGQEPVKKGIEMDYILRKGLDTVESLSAGARGSIFLSMQDLPKVGLSYEVHKLCQNISTTVGMTKSRALLTNVVKIFLLL